MARDKQHNLRLVNSSGKGSNSPKATCHLCIATASFFGAAAVGTLVLSVVWWLASFVPSLENLVTLKAAAIAGGIFGAMVAFLYHYMEALERDRSDFR